MLPPAATTWHQQHGSPGQALVSPPHVMTSNPNNLSPAEMQQQQRLRLATSGYMAPAAAPFSQPYGVNAVGGMRQQVPEGGRYGTTQRGEQYPLDLGPYLTQGTPLKMAPVAHDKSIELFAARFPEGFDLHDLTPPLQIRRDLRQLEVAEDHSVGAPEAFGGARKAGGGGRDRGRPAKAIDPNKLPWHIKDASHKNLIGREAKLDSSCYFVMIDKGDVIELVPMGSWYTFQSDLTVTDGEGAGVSSESALSSDLAERKRRLALRMEERAVARLASRLGQQPDEGSDNDSKHRAREQGEDPLYAEDAGLQHHRKKKLKSMMKSKRQNMRKDEDNVEHSALNVGAVKRAEVDWDFADDGKATDDEEDLGGEEGGADDEKFYQDKTNFESDEEEPEVLTKFGQQVTSALETQKEQDAEDELAQFSDDEEDATPTTKNGSATPANATANTTNAPSSGAATSGARLDEGSAGAAAVTPEGVRARVIRTLSLHGGRMATKDFIQNFHIASNKSELFKILQVGSQINIKYINTLYILSARLRSKKYAKYIHKLKTVLLPRCLNLQ